MARGLLINLILIWHKESCTTAIRIFDTIHLTQFQMNTPQVRIGNYIILNSIGSGRTQHVIISVGLNMSSSAALLQTLADVCFEGFLLGEISLKFLNDLLEICLSSLS